MTSHLAKSYMDPNSSLDEVFTDEDLLTYYTKSPTHHQKHEGFDQEVLIGRIKRRTDIIERMRNAYLRDVIAVKQFIGQHLADNHQQSLFQKWEESIPSLDLTQHFMLYSPSQQSLGVIPCETCGGSLEIVHHDNERLSILADSLENLKERTRKKLHDFGIIIAQKSMEIEKLENERENTVRMHRAQVTKSDAMMTMY